MIRREFKVNFKSFMIWFLILLVMFLIVYLIYPCIVTDDSMKSMDELMRLFPPEMLKAFNMDMSSISTAYGWFKTEGFMFILLIVGFYSSMLGGTIVLKEENDRTIEYLNSVPIKRGTIIINKVIVGVFYIVLMVLLLGLFNYCALMISGYLNQKQFLLLSVTPLLIGLPLFGISLLISTFMHKTRKIVGISLGMVFIFYLLNVLSELSSKVDFLKYFSIYTLADVRGVIADVSIKPILIVISLMITFLSIICAYINFNKKELML